MKYLREMKYNNGTEFLNLRITKCVEGWRTIGLKFDQKKKNHLLEHCDILLWHQRHLELRNDTTQMAEPPTVYVKPGLKQATASSKVTSSWTKVNYESCLERTFQWDWKISLEKERDKLNRSIVDFKLSPCSECWYTFFWVIPHRLTFVCQHFVTLCLFHLHRQVGTYPPTKMEQTECSEMLAYKIQTLGNYPEKSI